MENIINDLYKNLLLKIYKEGLESSPRGMKVKELIGNTFILNNPKDNIITLPEFEINLNYVKEELNWYLSGSNRIDFSPLIEKTWKKYSDDGIIANSAYGFYIFSQNQWNWVIQKLKEDRDSRQAIININQLNHKYKPTKDFPCTIYIQAFIRQDKLIWITNMRSNDIYYGFRNDLYCFTELQMKMARELKCLYGNYIHFTGSIHLYENQFEKVSKLL